MDKTKNEAKRAESATKPWQSRRTIILSIGVILIVAIIAGLAIYRERVAPLNIVVVEVNDTQIKMRYFLARVALSGEPAINMLSTLTREQMIKLAAGEPPFNITVTEEIIDEILREQAAGNGARIEEDEFREWYRQQLNETRLSDDEYRDVLRTNYLAMAMTEVLSRSVPTQGEQVFVNMIFVEEFTQGVKIKNEYESGEDFASLAVRYSKDPALQKAGGRIGWVPRGILNPALDRVAFNLNVGQVSEPIYLDQKRIVVVMVSDKAAVRDIDQDSLAVLKSKVMDDWYSEVYSDFDVEFHGLNNGYDSETDAWVSWQLVRMQRP